MRVLFAEKEVDDGNAERVERVKPDCSTDVLVSAPWATHWQWYSYDRRSYSGREHYPTGRGTPDTDIDARHPR